jgi:hypothetical protein
MIARWMIARRSVAAPDIQSLPRRRFLERTAAVAAGAPFVAGAYGLLYGRLNLETTSQTILLRRLPRAFEGFRICQLSDIHIGPFMPAEEIRKYVAIANAQKAEMVVLTGDFVTFDAATQQAVVEALSGLRAPFGVFGCLGNHEMWTGWRIRLPNCSGRRAFGFCAESTCRSPLTASPNLIGVDFRAHEGLGHR